MKLFAYASNMDVSTFAETVPSAKKIGNAKLSGYRFGFHLTGKDGSSKASLTPSDEADAVAWGVLIEFNDDELSNFFFQDDWFEWRTVNCLDESGEIHKAQAFITQAHATNDFILPFDRYKGKIVKIAKEQGLPDEYIANIEAMPAKARP